MEYKELQPFVGKIYHQGMKLNRQFNFNGYTMATDGYRFAAIKENNTDNTKGYENIYKVFINILEEVKSKSIYTFSRDQLKILEQRYKLIHQENKKLYRSDLIVGLNFINGDMVLFNKLNARTKSESLMHQYFNYKYFYEALKFFPRFKTVELMHFSKRSKPVVFNSNNRQLVLMPLLLRNLKEE